jgi:hypothetical protein
LIDRLRVQRIQQQHIHRIRRLHRRIIRKHIWRHIRQLHRSHLPVGVLFKKRNRLRLTVLTDLKIFFLQSARWLTLRFRNHDIHQHNPHIRLDRRLLHLRRGLRVSARRAR